MTKLNLSCAFTNYHVATRDKWPERLHDISVLADIFFRFTLRNLYHNSFLWNSILIKFPQLFYQSLHGKYRKIDPKTNNWDICVIVLYLILLNKSSEEINHEFQRRLSLFLPKFIHFPWRLSIRINTVLGQPKII